MAEFGRLVMSRDKPFESFCLRVKGEYKFQHCDKCQKQGCVDRKAE